MHRLRLLGTLLAVLWVGGCITMRVDLSYLEPPLGYPPLNRPSVIIPIKNAHRFCGGWGGAMACAKPEVKPCKIWIQEGLDPYTREMFIKHEQFHCDYPNVIEPHDQH